MRVDEGQLRRMVVEEITRNESIAHLTDDDLINEGLFDFLGKIFKKLSAPAEKKTDKVEKAVSGNVETDFDKNLPAVAAKAGVSSGLGQRPIPSTLRQS